MIKIVVGNMFDYPSGYLLVSSNVRGHCESPTSLMSQVLPRLPDDEVEEYKTNNLANHEYGSVDTYLFKNEEPFEFLLVGYPGTAHLDSFQLMMENVISILTIDGVSGANTSITMPLVGCSKTGLTIDEWAEVFNNVVKDQSANAEFIRDITIVCKTKEQKDFLDRIILLSLQAD